MPDPSLLTPSAVDKAASELHEAVVNEDATAAGQDVTCIIPSFSEQHATDPMPWTPVVTPDGFFYPKRDDRAILGYPVDGNPVILEWWPKATGPDVPL